MRERAWLITSWTGRSFLAAVLLKLLVLVALAATDGSATLEFLDRAVNLALIVLACVSIYQLTQLVRARMLWRVRRKLILSYILIGGGALLSLTVILAIAGIPLALFGVWMWRFSSKNIEAIEAGYNEYLSSSPASSPA